MVRLLLKLDYLIIFVISHNYFIISCHIWSFFFFVNYLSSSSCIFFVFPYIMYSYILDILFLIVLSFSFGGHFLNGNSVSPYCFPLPTVLLHIVFFLWWWLLLLVGVYFCTVVKSIIKHDMNRQVFIHFFPFDFLAERWADWCIDCTVNQGRSLVARIKEHAGISKNFTTHLSK